MTPKEHIDKADQLLERAELMRAKYGVCVESAPYVDVLAALAQAHASTAQAQLMAVGVPA